MAVPLEHIISRWLYNKNIGVSQHLLKEKLQTHSDYPSLLAISDTLDELGIENVALQIDKNSLEEVPLPFLAHDVARSGFIVIDNIDKQIKAKPEFEKSFNGTILLAEKPDNWEQAENEKRLAEEKYNLQKLIASIIFIAGLAMLSLLNGFSWQLTGLLISSLAGMGIAALIVQHELGINTTLGDKLCGADTSNGCDAVMNSKGNRMGKWLSWADAGIIYFTAYSLLLVISLYTNNTITPLALLSVAALPFTIFSVYYQWRVVKNWCRLCLLTVAVLWIQAILLFVAGNISFATGGFLQSVTYNNLLHAAFIFTGVSAAWLLLIKPALQNNKQLLSEKFSLLRFKNNPDVFNAYLKKQRKVDTTSFENDLQLGNPEAAVQIMVACNPYCGPCAKAHEVLHELAEKNDIGLTLRFTVKATDPEDKKTQTVQYLLQLLQGSNAMQKRKILHDWFAGMNYEKFINKHPIPGHLPDVTEQLTQQEQWAKEAEIKFTPTIFINGWELPKHYQAKDLKFMIKNFEITVNSAVTGAVENKYIPA